MSLKKTETQTYKAITNQQYLNAKQLSILSLVIIVLIQMIPIFVTRTPYLEWMLLGFTAAVSTCAVMGAILVQHNADKISKLYRSAFNSDFYETIGLFTQLKNTIQEQADKEGLDFKEEVENLGIDSYAVVRGYLESFREHYNISQSESDLGVIEAPEYENERELFS